MERRQYKKRLWTKEEDQILMEYLSAHGRGRWNDIAKATGLKRSGRSCRTRWMNYLCPNVKHGEFSEEEEELIIRLHNLLGNRWSLIAGRVPGRTDNQVKNHWKAHLCKKFKPRNNNEVGPSTTLFGDDGGQEGKSLELLASGNSTTKLPSNDGYCSIVTRHQVADGFPKGTIMTGAPQEQTMSEFHLNSSPSNISDPDTTSLMEFLDEFSIDVALYDF
ncbi:hypothetical protein AAC387_Pa04g2891 [Persea americana]